MPQDSDTPHDSPAPHADPLADVQDPATTSSYANWIPLDPPGLTRVARLIQDFSLREPERYEDWPTDPDASRLTAYSELIANPPDLSVPNSHYSFLYRDADHIIRKDCARQAQPVAARLPCAGCGAQLARFAGRRLIWADSHVAREAAHWRCKKCRRHR